MQKEICLLLFLFVSLKLVSFDFFTYVPYQGKMKEIKTDNFIIVFPEKYSGTALIVASFAEEIHTKLSPLLNWKPKEKTYIILTDNSDSPNGMGIPFLRNTILLYLSKTELAYTLKNFTNPLYSLILHEYAHILHLEQVRGGALFWRILYGKLYMPVAVNFPWYIEGVAMVAESKYSQNGRLVTNYNKSLLRNAAKNKKIPSFDKLIYPIVDYPYGNAAYFYGGNFLNYLYNTYGKEKFDSIYIGISNDIWAFVLMFVMNFKNIYGKSLNDLWNEWILYEEKEALSYQEDNYEYQKLTNLQGRVSSFDKIENFFVLTAESYKKEVGLFKLDKNNKVKLLEIGYFGNVSKTNQKDYIVFTKLTKYPDDFTYYDLYSFNLKTFIETRLTKKERIQYACFAKNKNAGILVSNDIVRPKLFRANFNTNKITKKLINIPQEITFIQKPSINNEGTKVLFSAKTKDGVFKIYQLDLNTEKITQFEDIEGELPQFIDENKFSYIGTDNSTDSLFEYIQDTKENFRILSSFGNINSAMVIDEKIYYVNQTVDGEELFVTNNDKKIIGLPQVSQVKLEKQILIDNFKIKDFNIGRVLYPTCWGIIPALLSNSSIYIPIGNSYFPIPFIAPQFFIYNEIPTSRFSYTASITLDYLRWYPNNSLSLNFKLPAGFLTYQWNNGMAGSKNIVGLQFYESRKYKNRFPIYFSNFIQYYFDVPLLNYGNIYFSLATSHVFYEYDFKLDRPKNFINFSENFGYYYNISRPNASRWDRGFRFDISARQSIKGIADNENSYVLRGSLEGRIPFKNVFLFMYFDGGIDFLQQNTFTLSSTVFSLQNGLIGSGGNGASIDMKAFPIQITHSSTSFTFFYNKAGFDITVYKRSHYWHFATLGFKEFFIKAYTEFAAVFNKKNVIYSDIFFDVALELTVDLFLAYGNGVVEFTLGGALGHSGGQSIPLQEFRPAWSVFGAINFRLFN